VHLYIISFSLTVHVAYRFEEFINKEIYEIYIDS